MSYENFYEWLHKQENFNEWYNGDGWAVDKDILVKGNKVYSPETCCLVPQNVNVLFVTQKNNRGNLPIGVYYHKNQNKYIAQYNNKYLKNSQTYLGSYDNSLEAFMEYKIYKENLIKTIAQKEYEKGNITQKCYEAMMRYEVEITD